jgi:Ankyrin repeats (3 copies)
MMMDELWKQAVRQITDGAYFQIEKTLGGGDAFDDRIIQWFDHGYFANEPEALAETVTCASFLGRAKVVAHLLDSGVDPVAGMRSGMNGFHYAASCGQLEVVKVMIERTVPMEILNRYGATVLGQALWSAIHEHESTHAEIIEALISGGAKVRPGTPEWWEEQDVPSAETKARVTTALRRALGECRVSESATHNHD